MHRGRIPDFDLEQLLKERNRLDSRRYSPLTVSPISEEEYKTCTSVLQTRLSTLAKEKQDLWEQLHRQTMVLTSTVAGELAVTTLERHERDAIEHQAGPDRPDAGRSA